MGVAPGTKSMEKYISLPGGKPVISSGKTFWNSRMTHKVSKFSFSICCLLVSICTMYI